MLVTELLKMAGRPITEPERIAIVSVLTTPNSLSKETDISKMATEIFSKAADELLNKEITQF
jgi:hypothetical protein